MADRNSLKIADPNAISDDDPFAELTRIMGFDPRQPARPQNAPDPVLADDFDIDLEKELMGEFGLDMDPEISAAENASASQPVDAPAHDMPMHDLDEAVAASMQDFDFDLDEAPHAAAPEVEFERDFDEALTQSFDAEAQPQAHWPAEEEINAPIAAEENAYSAPEAVARQDFDAHFDEAMANVDMDFDLRAEPAYELDAPQAPELFAHDSAAYDEGREAERQAENLDAEEPQAVVAADPFDEAFSLDFDDAPAQAPAVEPAAPVVAKEERSLEDELNALLGNMGARIAKPESAVISRSWASTAGAGTARAADPFVVAAAGYGAHQSSLSQANIVDQAAEPDLDAMLLHELARSDMGAEPQAEAVADDAGADINFDAADFEAFSRDDEAEQAAAVAAREAPSLARSWGRGTPVMATQPTPVEAPAPSVSAYQPVPEPVYEPEEVAELDEPPLAAAHDEMPDVETVDVPERVVALVDDLDLPELAFEEDRPQPAAFDDLDAEFASLLSDMNSAEAAPVSPRQPSYDDEAYESGFKRSAPQIHGDAQAYAAPHPAEAAAVASPSYDDDFDAPMAHDGRPFAPVDTFADELDYDPELDEAMAVPGLAMAENAAQPRRRGLLVAAVVGAVAIIGGIGAFALSPGGSGNGGAPVLVKADDAPIKVKPENPGGTVVPNQDNKVYEAVAKGVQPAAPAQQKLVAETQEPVNVNTAAPQNRVVDLSPDDGNGVEAGGTTTPAAKSEDRIDQSAQDTAGSSVNPAVAVVTPRKVRTMVVKPDGTLAPREDPTPAAPLVAAESADPAPQRVVSAPAETQDQTGAVQAPANAAAEQPASEPAVKPAAKAKANAQSATTPATVAAAPQRPSDQPVDIVGEVKPDEVASISPTAVASGSWSMQIASQPSVDSAQSTYKDLARRYAGILDGHAVNIVKADIAGKGTFYRVRVPANSRNDAITLCESYKAAGGNCFVSK